MIKQTFFKTLGGLTLILLVFITGCSKDDGYKKGTDEEKVVVAIGISASPSAGGTITGAGNLTVGDLATAVAVPATGYYFTNWTENGTVVAITTSYPFIVTANKTLVANFATTPPVIPTPPSGASSINLGTSADFAILSKAGISTTGTTAITGNIGSSPIAAAGITGFGLIMDTDNTSSHTGIVTGKVYAANYTAPTPSKMTTAISDMETAFSAGNGMVNPSPIVNLYAGDISNRTLPAGLYKWTTNVLITNKGVTLNGGPNDIWVFQIAQNLTVDNSAIITLAGGAQAKNIFWVVSGQATLGTAADFSGIVLSKTLISLNTGAKVKGRLLAQTAVTLNASTVTQPVN